MAVKTKEIRIGIMMDGDNTIFLDAKDILLLFLCEDKKDTKEVRAYKYHISQQIANIIRNPFPELLK